MNVLLHRQPAQHLEPASMPFLIILKNIFYTICLVIQILQRLQIIELYIENC